MLIGHLQCCADVRGIEAQADEVFIQRPQILSQRRAGRRHRTARIRRRGWRDSLKCRTCVKTEPRATLLQAGMTPRQTLCRGGIAASAAKFEYLGHVDASFQVQDSRFTAYRVGRLDTCAAAAACGAACNTQ